MNIDVLPFVGSRVVLTQQRWTLKRPAEVKSRPKDSAGQAVPLPVVLEQPTTLRRWKPSLKKSNDCVNVFPEDTSKCQTLPNRTFFQQSVSTYTATINYAPNTATNIHVEYLVDMCSSLSNMPSMTPSLCRRKWPIPGSVIILNCGNRRDYGKYIVEYCRHFCLRVF